MTRFMNRAMVVAAAAAAVVAIPTGVAMADSGVVNGGFETQVSTTGILPDGYGYWRGDVSEIIGSLSGVNPASGEGMLHFINTTATGPSSASGAELWQIIDISEALSRIQQGGASATLSALVNRVVGDGPIDTSFQLSLYAYEGDASTFPAQWGHGELAQASAGMQTDDSTETWQDLLVSLDLPTNTGFVVVRIASRENVFNDASGREFHGHFMDDVEFNVIPGPGSMGLMAAAGLVMAGSRRRRTA